MELKPKNVHERLVDGWIVCAYCGVKMRNAGGSTAHDHPRSCYEKWGLKKELLDEYYGASGNGSGSV